MIGGLALCLSGLVMRGAIAAPGPLEDPTGWNVLRGMAIRAGVVEVGTRSGVKSMDPATGGWVYTPGTRSVIGPPLTRAERARWTRQLLREWDVPLDILRRGDDSATPWLLCRGQAGDLCVVQAGRSPMLELRADIPEVRGFAAQDGMFWVATPNGVLEADVAAGRARMLRTTEPYRSVVLTVTLTSGRFFVNAEDGLFRIGVDGSLQALGPSPISERCGGRQRFNSAAVVGATLFISGENSMCGARALLHAFSASGGWSVPRDMPWPGGIRLMADGLTLLGWSNQDTGDEGAGSSFTGGFGRWDPAQESWDVYTSNAVDVVLSNPVRAREYFLFPDQPSDDEAKWGRRILWIPPGQRAPVPASRDQERRWTDEFPRDWESPYPLEDGKAPSRDGYDRMMIWSGHVIARFAEVPDPEGMREVVPRER